jgi:hypothetical protein
MYGTKSGGLLVKLPTYIAKSRENWLAAGVGNPGKFIGLWVGCIGWFSATLLLPQLHK